MNNLQKSNSPLIPLVFLKQAGRWKEKISGNIFLINSCTKESAEVLAGMLIIGVVLLNLMGEKLEQLKIKSPTDSLLDELAEKLKLIDEIFSTSFFNEIVNRSFKIDENLIDDFQKEIEKDKTREIINSFTYESFGILYEHLKYKHSKLFQDKKAKRKAASIYYTPAYIVDYIIERTIGEKLKGKNPEEIKKLKIIDPSCGSGIFLLRAFHRLVDNSPDLSLEYKKEVLLNNIFGTDIDPKAVEITKFSLLLCLLKNEKTIENSLPDLSKNIFCSNSLIDEDTLFHPDAGKYDIIIGNPPYNIKLNTAEKKILKKKYETGNSDTAALFMLFAGENLKPGGINGFVIPKPFVYSSKWKDLRDDTLTGITEIIDCGKAWNDVKLEQVIYIYQKGKVFEEYKSGKRAGEEIFISGIIDKKYYNQFGLLLNGISTEELSVGLKIKSSGIFLNDIITNHRGAAFQNILLQENSDFKVIGGKQISPFTIEDDVKGYLTLDSLNDSKSILKENSIIVQNIVAHIQKPEPGIKIIAALASSFDWKNYLILDTVNQLRNKSDYSSEFICALLNSKLISWYVYNFIFGRAIRTMHFDNYVTKRIPMPNLDLKINRHRKLHDKVTRLTLKIINKKQEKNFKKYLKVQAEIDELVVDLFGISEREKRIIG